MEPKAQSANNGSQALRKYGPLAAIVVALGAAWFGGLFDYFSLSKLIMHRESLAAQVAANFPLAILVYCLIYIVLVAVSFPGASLLTLISGFLFGGFVGGSATVVSATIGAVIIFLVARSSFGDFLERRAGGFVAKLIDGFREDSFNYLLSLRLTPVFPFWVVNIVPAMLNMKVGPYALATFLGIIPGTFAYSFVGAGLGSIIEAQELAHPGCGAAGTCAIDVKALVTPQIVFAMVALGLVALAPVILKRLGFKFGRTS